MSALAAQKLPDYTAARRNMIEGQIRPNKVRDEGVLTTLETLPRELFVPKTLMGVAYIDESVPVAAGRFLMAPMIVARMLTEAAVKPSDKVLVIAPGTGYVAAALASLAAQVVAVESDADLHRRMAATLASLRIQNVVAHCAPMQDGWKPDAPYDLIFIDGAVDDVPDVVLRQIRNGGKLIAVVRHYGAAHAAHTGEARLYEKSDETVTCRALFDANVALLPGFAANPKFSF